jgi:hypothetical protein
MGQLEEEVLLERSNPPESAQPSDSMAGLRAEEGDAPESHIRLPDSSGIDIVEESSAISGVPVALTADSLTGAHVREDSAAATDKTSVLPDAVGPGDPSEKVTSVDNDEDEEEQEEAQATQAGSGCRQS